MTTPSGRHFLQTPGPTNVPEGVLRAISRPTIDHRGPEFIHLVGSLLEDLGQVFATSDPIVIYPSSGTGAWEAALTNTLSPGDRIVVVETGFFSSQWCAMAERLGLDVHVVEGDWRSPADITGLAERLDGDPGGAIRAVMVVHNETSTGVTSDIPAVREALDRAGHPALLLVDTISSLASLDYRHSEWGVDVTVGCSQKGLMLPPGLGFNAVSAKALAARQAARLPRSYWDWEAVIEANRSGVFPYTPATNMLFGLRVAVDMLLEEGLPQVFARHARHGAATRAAVRAWGLEFQSSDEAAFSDSLTAVRVPEGSNADDLRQIALERFDLSLGSGLGRLAGSVFRIGHLGGINDLMLAGTLAGVQAGLALSGIPMSGDGVAAAAELMSSGGPL